MAGEVRGTAAPRWTTRGPDSKHTKKGKLSHRRSELDRAPGCLWLFVAVAVADFGIGCLLFQLRPWLACRMEPEVLVFVWI